MITIDIPTPVKLPERDPAGSGEADGGAGMPSADNYFGAGWNACLDELSKLGPLYQSPRAAIGNAEAASAPTDLEKRFAAPPKIALPTALEDEFVSAYQWGWRDGVNAIASAAPDPKSLVCWYTPDEAYARGWNAFRDALVPISPQPIDPAALSDSREAFEAWFATSPMATHYARNPSNKDWYHDSYVQTAWGAWQAARIAPPAQSDEAAMLRFISECDGVSINKWLVQVRKGTVWGTCYFKNPETGTPVFMASDPLDALRHAINAIRSGK